MYVYQLVVTYEKLEGGIDQKIVAGACTFDSIDVRVVSYFFKRGPLSINGIFACFYAKNGVYTEGSPFKKIKAPRITTRGFFITQKKN
jgi:hypothetical protein